MLGLDRSRLHLTPGMTGPWQVLGARVPMQEMVGIDYLYVANWSLWLDLKLLLRTVRGTCSAAATSEPSRRDSRRRTADPRKFGTSTSARQNRGPSGVADRAPHARANSMIEPNRGRPRSGSPGADSAPLPSATPSSTSACRRCARATCPPSAWGDGALLSAARSGVRAVPAGAARGVRGAGRDLHASTPTSPPTRIPGSPTRATTWSLRLSGSGSMGTVW